MKHCNGDIYSLFSRVDIFINIMYYIVCHSRFMLYYNEITYTYFIRVITESELIIAILLGLTIFLITKIATRRSFT